MTMYNFTQEINHSDQLVLQIRQTNISTALDRIDTVGTGSDMDISVWFRDVLSEEDEIILDLLMSTYVEILPVIVPPKVIQILGSDSLTLNPFGAKLTPAAGTLTNCDVVLPANMVLKGGIIFSNNSVIGDHISISVLDKDNVLGFGATPEAPIVLGTYVISWYVMPGIENKVEDISISQPMPQGLYLRVAYTSVGEEAPIVLLNLISYTGEI